MADTLEKQKFNLERAIKEADNDVAKRALNDALEVVNRKLAGKTKRTTVLTDGTTVEVGDKVCTFHALIGGNDKDRPVLQITRRTITAINPSGELSTSEPDRYSRRFGYEEVWTTVKPSRYSKIYASTPEGVRAGYDARLRLQLQATNDEIENLQTERRNTQLLIEENRRSKDQVFDK